MDFRLEPGHLKKVGLQAMLRHRETLSDARGAYLRSLEHGDKKKSKLKESTNETNTLPNKQPKQKNKQTKEKREDMKRHGSG